VIFVQLHISIKMRFTYTLLLIIGLHMMSFAQKQSLIDSVSIKLNQIDAEKRAGDTDLALLNLEDLRWFIKREKVFIPAKYLVSALSVYNDNLDTKGAARFLEDASATLTNITTDSIRISVTKELVRIYEARGSADKALALQKQLTENVVSEKDLQMASRLDSVQHRLDSISAARLTEIGAEHQVFKINKERAWLLGGVLSLVFLTLLAAQWYQYNKHTHQNEDKQRELDHLRGFLNTQNTPDTYIAQPIQPAHVPQPATKATLEPTNNLRSSADVAEPIEKTTLLPIKPTYSAIPSQNTSNNAMYQPKYLALMVQPNRQIAMYIKSLLGQEYELEITDSMSDAIEIAKTQIPDIVICDTALGNNGSGIDFSRVLKQDVRTNHIPIVLMSNAIGTEAEAQLIRSSADLIIPRPLIDDDLNEQLKILFKSRIRAHDQFTSIMQLWFTSAKENPADQFLRSLLVNMEHHIPDASFSPADLAKIMQYDKQIFNRKVQALTGREAQDIMRILRLEKAKFLLENKVAPVQVIASLVGFDNQGAFSRAFKDHFGNTNILMLNA
jgi:AraC-like DNA-binding protein